jgi:glycosyltransferase involved in cell wall biosynthesis
LFTKAQENEFNLMKLSIITITYNAENVLESTLKSVFGQTNQNFEYIIIDGASKDKTLKIAEKYGVKNIYSEPDKGIYDAMNKGPKIAKGEYIWFMNAGDQIFDNEVVGNLFKAFSENADVYYSDTLIVDESDNPVGLRSKITPHQLPNPLKWQDFQYGMVVCHQSFIARKSICQPYLLNHHYSADIDWEINCLKASKKTIYLNFILSKYLTGGFSVKNLKASLIDRFQILKKHFGFWNTIISHILIGFRGLKFIIAKKKKYW